MSENTGFRALTYELVELTVVEDSPIPGHKKAIERTQIHRSMQDRDNVMLCAFHRYLTGGFRPENRYIPLHEIRDIVERLRQHKVDDIPNIMTPDRIEAYYVVKDALDFELLKSGDPSVVAMLHPEDASAIISMVRERSISKWDEITDFLAKLSTGSKALSEGML
jgi:hypothetical protein